MARFALRHWTALLIVIVVAGWAIFYLPNTPSYAIYQLKQAIDARDGTAAATYVDFQQVVRNAGYEMVQEKNGGGSDPSSVLGQLFGKGAVDLFSGPMAALVQQWAVQQVNDGSREVQMPLEAVAGAVVLLHHDGDSAYTQWTDHHGRVWEVRMARENGAWKIVQVKNVKQLLERLQQQQQRHLASPPS